ncbi:MAG: hypothetical protein LBV77_05140 [Candidatus Adiutrix intracellularis]|nr:hypothetical protein [Candidatus Adiutrix intracellularis]
MGPESSLGKLKKPTEVKTASVFCALNLVLPLARHPGETRGLLLETKV